MDARGVFRAGNEHIAAIVRHAPGTVASFICECDDEDCLGEVPLTAEEYDSVRSQEHRYVVVPGHEYDDEPVEQQDRYTLVEPATLRRDLLGR